MSTALAPIDVNTYALIADGDIEELTEAISENLNGGALSLKNLTRITTPTGGSTVFQVPTPEGMKNAETLEGIILVQQPRRVFYSRPMGAGGDENNRPDCFSNDSLVGVGTRFAGDEPGQHDCATCPLSQWGANGEKPRCSQRRQLFLLREGDVLPIIVDLPSTSLKNVDAYLGGLAISALTYYYAVTQIGLKSELRKGSKNAYTEYTFKQVGIVPKELRPQIKDYQKAIKAMVLQPTPDSVGGTGTTVEVTGEMEDIEL
jgi:hypothetical protein